MSQPSRKSSESVAVFTHIVRAEDLNMHGSLFGGKLMAFMDTCAAITAMRHSQRNCVTAYISDVHFQAPVRMGHILNIRSSLHFTARTSMEILCAATREDHLSGDVKEVCCALFTFVALDSDNLPTAVAPVELETHEDKRLNAEAKTRYEARKHTAKQSDTLQRGK